jgi:hypothetical protein
MFETVYALWRYEDGPREGVADYQGHPHVFVSEWNAEFDGYGNAFLLKPIDGDTFRLVMEDWVICRRMTAPTIRAETNIDTDPATPEDLFRREELHRLLREPLTVDPARARQVYPMGVRPVERSLPVDPVGVVRLAAEFCASANPARWNGYLLPLMAVRWSAVA